MSRYKTDNKQPRFRYSVLARCVAWANICSGSFPLAVTFFANGSTCAACGSATVELENTVTADNNVENVASLAANAGTF